MTGEKEREEREIFTNFHHKWLQSPGLFHKEASEARSPELHVVAEACFLGQVSATFTGALAGVNQRSDMGCQHHQWQLNLLHSVGLSSDSDPLCLVHGFENLILC